MYESNCIRKHNNKPSAICKHTKLNLILASWSEKKKKPFILNNMNALGYFIFIIYEYLFYHVKPDQFYSVCYFVQKVWLWKSFFEKKKCDFEMFHIF